MHIFQIKKSIRFLAYISKSAFTCIYSISFLLILSTAFSCSQKKDTVSYVNPFIGTGAHGHTFPGATLPFGMVQLSPDTRTGNWDACSGYHFSDSAIIGFSHTHLSGTGCADLGDILIRPSSQALSSLVKNDKISASTFTRDTEVAQPGYYKVNIENDQIRCELTATNHVGIHRYTFTNKSEVGIILDLSHQLETEESKLQIQSISENEICGFRFSKGWAENQKLFFIARFSSPLQNVKLWSHGSYVDYKLPFNSNDIKLELNWDELSAKTIEMHVGISSVSIEGARKNLIAEAPEFKFDYYKQNAAEAWSNKLAGIAIESTNNRDKEIFYTSLYHCFIAPYEISDVDGSYRGIDGGVHKDTLQNHYTAFSLWDTFRAWHPLMTLLDEQFVTEMINSMLAYYQQSGELPVWPLWGSETNTMIGYHSVSVITDAWMKGIRGFDEKLALEAMIASANTTRKGNEEYRELGFIPANSKRESVSCLLEYAYDDWCISQFAEQLGEPEIAKEYAQRALNYRNIFDGNTCFFRGKQDNGNWIQPFDPFEVSRDMTEANAWQYRFFVPHDVRGLVNMFGGEKAFSSALDTLFNVQADVKGELSDITGLLGQYAHGNEPSHHMAYLYSFVGQPWKTQYYVNKLQTEMYDNTPEGISGNEDCGQMSAWHVMSSLGFYPVCPGSNEYILTTPRFEEIRLQLGNGNKIQIETDKNPMENPYIKRVLLNGEALNAPFITHQQLIAGCTLSFELVSEPQNKNVEQDIQILPYSMTQEQQVSIPYVTNNVNQFLDSCTIEMGVATNGANIYYTLDGTEPTQKSAKYESKFVLNQSQTIKIKAFKVGYKVSPLCILEVNKAVFQPALKQKLSKNGVLFRYFEGTFSTVADMDRLKPVKDGIINNFTLEPALQEDHFGFTFETYVKIPKSGLYEFYTISDDGSVLWIDNKKVVDNDGSHAAIKASGTVALKKGIHRINVSYIEDYEGHSLEVGMSEKGNPSKQILDYNLWR